MQSQNVAAVVALRHLGLLPDTAGRPEGARVTPADEQEALSAARSAPVVGVRDFTDALQWLKENPKR